MTWKWLRRRNLKTETESLLITAQNNVIRTDNVKSKIDTTLKNSKCGSCGDRDETVNDISKYSQLEQKEYKSRYDWLGKVIHWELCKRLKFDHIDK